MQPTIFEATNYESRTDLEAVIRAEVGTDEATNRTAGHKITGTREGLKKLFLDDLTTIFGVVCEISDTPTKGLLDKSEKNK